MTYTTILCRFAKPICMFTVLAVILELTLASVPAQQRPEDIVKASASATKVEPSGRQSISVVLDIHHRWKVFANPVQNATFAKHEAIVSVTAKGQPLEARVTYPSSKYDQEAKLRYYDGKVTITLRVSRDPKETTPLELLVRVSPFSDFACCPPRKIRILLP